MSALCHYCGTQIDEDDIDYCPKCGPSGSLRDRCPACGKLTEEGEEQFRKRAEARFLEDHPSSSKSEVIAQIRNDFVKIRHTIQDLSNAYPGWGDRLINVEGLINCGLISLYDVMQEMKKVEGAKNGTL